jgi:hypothetical protein
LSSPPPYTYPLNHIQLHCNHYYHRCLRCTISVTAFFSYQQNLIWAHKGKSKKLVAFLLPLKKKEKYFVSCFCEI